MIHSDVFQNFVFLVQPKVDIFEIVDVGSGVAGSTHLPMMLGSVNELVEENVFM